MAEREFIMGLNRQDRPDLDLDLVDDPRRFRSGKAKVETLGSIRESFVIDADEVQ